MFSKSGFFVRKKNTKKRRQDTGQKRDKKNEKEKRERERETEREGSFGSSLSLPLLACPPPPDQFFFVFFGETSESLNKRAVDFLREKGEIVCLFFLT